jgi:drebrin-like protein
MVDEDWWMGENARGQSGLFPSNYVELVEGDDAPPAVTDNNNNNNTTTTTTTTNMDSTPAASLPGGSKAAPTATALYDYEAAGEQF